MDEQARRERQRMHVKNSYYRQQEKMKTLRKEVGELEEAYARLVESKQVLEFGAMLDTSGSLQHSMELVEKYTQLSIKKEALRRENGQLALIAAKHEQFQLKAQHLLDTEDLPTIALQADDSFGTPLGWGSSQELEATTSFQPLTVQECHEIASKAYREICAFLQSNNYLTSGAVLYGWRDQRHLAPDHVKFTLNKRFPGTTPMELSARAWQVTSSPRGLAGLYSPTMRLSLKRLQVVDENNVVMYREIPSSRPAAIVKSLFLVSRFHVDASYIILFRSVDCTRLQRRPGDSRESEQRTDDGWLDMFTWTLFDEDPNDANAVIFSYGGIVYSTAAASTHVWMMEILLLALRWEARVVGPTFMLRD